VNLSLHGRSRAAGPAEATCDTDILFSGANAPPIPDRLHEVCVIDLDSAADGLRRFRIESTQLQVEFEARSAQVHRGAGAALFTAVPPPHVPWHVRAGFSLLVSVLGIPGIGSLILRRRSAH
jgi:hypothetical protein